MRVRRRRGELVTRHLLTEISVSVASEVHPTCDQLNACAGCGIGAIPPWLCEGWRSACRGGKSQAPYGEGLCLVLAQGSFPPTEQPFRSPWRPWQLSRDSCLHGFPFSRRQYFRASRPRTRRFCLELRTGP